MQHLIGDEDFGKACEIPELKRLDPKLQRFIWNWTHNGCNATRAAVAAGYTATVGPGLLKRQDVLDATIALTDRMIHSATIPAIVAIDEIVRDPHHKDRLKAAGMILNRTGWPEVQEHRVRVEKVPDEKAMLQAAVALARRMGIDPLTLIGPNSIKPDLELEATEIPDPLPDGSDI